MALGTSLTSHIQFSLVKWQIVDSSCSCHETYYISHELLSGSLMISLLHLLCLRR